jgi:hypothetical protein
MNAGFRLSQVTLTDLLQSLGWLRGHHHAERLAAAPTFRLISLQRILDRAVRMAINRLTLSP